MDIDRLRLVCTHWMRRARYAQGKYSRTEFVWIILDVARALSTERTGDIHAIERNVLLQYSVSQLHDFASTLGKSIRSFTLSGVLCILFRLFFRLPPPSVCRKEHISDSAYFRSYMNAKEIVWIKKIIIIIIIIVDKQLRL